MASRERNSAYDTKEISQGSTTSTNTSTPEFVNAGYDRYEQIRREWKAVLHYHNADMTHFISTNSGDVPLTQ